MEVGFEHLESLRVGEVVVHDNPQSAPGEVSFLILTDSPLVSSAVAKNVTRSPVRGFSRWVADSPSWFSPCFPPKPCIPAKYEINKNVLFTGVRVERLLHEALACQGIFQHLDKLSVRDIAGALLIIGDSDIVRPEHAVEMFRLLGGGVVGDLAGLPDSRLAILPGTTHVTLVDRPEWLISMIGEFLDTPVPEAK